MFLKYISAINRVSRAESRRFDPRRSCSSNGYDFLRAVAQFAQHLLRVLAEMGGRRVAIGRGRREADEAEEIFSTLMGEVVEPRKEFIQTNALSVSNLDV